MAEGTPCCPVGAREDAEAISAALRAGGPEGSVRKVAERFGVGKTAVGEHRACLGLRLEPTLVIVGQADTSRTGADSGKDRADTGSGGASRAVIVGSARAPLERFDPPPPQRLPELAARVRQITNTAALGEWRGSLTVEAMARAWGCDRATVIAYAKHAGFDASREAGPVELQIINSIGVNRSVRDEARKDAKAMREIRDAATASARDLERQAALLERDAAAATSATDLLAAIKARGAAGELREQGLAALRTATNAQRSASQAAKVALVAQQQADVLAGIFDRGDGLQVNVSVRADGDFQAVWGLIRRILEVRAPGAAPIVEEGLGVWDEAGGGAGGEAALERWLGGVELTPDEEGTYQR